MSTLATVVEFSDMIDLKEYRIQAGLDMTSCLDTLTLMVSSNYFLNGKVELQKIDCLANITNSGDGNISIDSEVRVASVYYKAQRKLLYGDNTISIIN